MKTAIITTASNMSEKTYARICRGFSERVDELIITHVIDDGIIGGFIADIDGEIFDLSISSQIEKMQKQITK